MRTTIIAALFLALVGSALRAQAADKPEIGTFGFDVAGMDQSVAPGADFYAYANGGWALATPIPPDKSNLGMFTRLDDLNRQRVKAILDEARHDPASRAGAAYAAFLDRATVEARGLAPVRPWLSRIDALTSRADYARLVAEALREGVQGPFEVAVAQDDHDPDAYVLKIAQAGLGLPDRDYYLRSDPTMAAVRTAYRDHLAR
ncbi:MAG TPA: M13 family metallopeptidase N-terminal domain-containing protein, partial [Caulobacter sp.]|nr:M13 family metallopeptidase N-terminal domain-containing protein [Caulobacter sp.]